MPGLRVENGMNLREGNAPEAIPSLDPVSLL